MSGEGKVHNVPAGSFRKGHHMEQKDEAMMEEKKIIINNEIKVDVNEKQMTEEEKLDAMPPIKLLLHAASIGDEAGVRKALERGAKINETDPGPIVVKSDKKDDDKSASIYRDYIYTGDGAIHKAAESGHQHIINFLWLKEADVDLKNRIGSTALHKAVANNHTDVVTELLLRQARVDITNNIGNTPLHCASYSGNVEIAKILLDGGAWRTLPVTNKANMLPIDYARKKGMQELLEQYTKQFHLASASFHRLPSVKNNNNNNINDSQKHLLPPGGSFRAGEEKGDNNTTTTTTTNNNNNNNNKGERKSVTMHLPTNISFSAKKKDKPEKRADVVEEVNETEDNDMETEEKAVAAPLTAQDETK